MILTVDSNSEKNCLHYFQIRVIMLARDMKILACRQWQARVQKEVNVMNKYELALVVSSKIEDEVRNDVVEKAKAIVVNAGGQISEVEEWGKKKLAYEIQKMSEGFYYFIHFDAESTAPAEVESRVRILDNVLRFLVVRADEA